MNEIELELARLVSELVGCSIDCVEIRNQGVAMNDGQPWRLHLVENVWRPRLKGMYIITEDGKLRPKRAREEDLNDRQQRFAAEYRSAIKTVEKLPKNLEFYTWTVKDKEWEWIGWAVEGELLFSNYLEPKDRQQNI